MVVTQLAQIRARIKKSLLAQLRVPFITIKLALGPFFAGALDCLSSRYGTASPQHERCDNTNAQKANDLDEHVAGCVNTRKAVPVPIGNVGRQRGQYSGKQNEAHSAGETRDACLREEDHDQDRFEEFGTEFDSEPFAKRQRAPGPMIHENTRRIRRHFVGHVFHRFVMCAIDVQINMTMPPRIPARRIFISRKAEGWRRNLEGKIKN